VKWSGTIAAGSKSKQQFAFEDFFATALDLAGLDPSVHLPTDQTDGDSLVPTLRGKKQPQKRFIYHEYCAPNENKQGWGQALRVGDWSGVCVGSNLKGTVHAVARFQRIFVTDDSVGRIVSA
jgi:arylsulfatase A-like enzyme